MAAANVTPEPAAVNGGTVHVIATSFEGTLEALEAATTLARGLRGRVVVFFRRASASLNLSDQHINGDESLNALRRQAESYTPRPKVLSCGCENAIDFVQLFQSPGLVVIGGEARWWWPTAEQRLAHTLTTLGCHVTFVHVPRGRFVPPFIAAAREQTRTAVHEPWDERNVE
jgi:hypothetical protein